MEKIYAVVVMFEHFPTLQNSSLRKEEKKKKKHIYEMKYLAVQKSRQWISAAALGTTSSVHICEPPALIHLNQSKVPL